MLPIEEFVQSHIDEFKLNDENHLICTTEFKNQLYEFYHKLASEQVEMPAEFAQIIHDNLWDLM